MHTMLKEYRRFLNTYNGLLNTNQYKSLSGPKHLICEGTCQPDTADFLMELCRRMEIDPVRLLEIVAESNTALDDKDRKNQLPEALRFNGLTVQFEHRRVFRDCLHHDEVHEAFAEYLSVMKNR